VDLRPWLENARAHGIRSSSAFPLHQGGHVIGALTIYSDEPGFFKEEEVSLVLSLSRDVSFALDSLESERMRSEAENALRVLNEELEDRVRTRTADLEDANRELESFVYSVSHDLRAPLRTIAGFARIVKDDYGQQLDDPGRDGLLRIIRSAERMSRLMEELLELSRISRNVLSKENVDLSALAAIVVAELREADPARTVEVVIKEKMQAMADPRLMELGLSNLLGNAWKFTAKTEGARIAFGSEERPAGGGREAVYFVRDNGAGFAQEFAEKIFWPFHRLHTDAEFEGSGIGLSIVERVIRRHGGKIWAEGSPGRGAVFYFTIS
jgi:signal transduction histidine kinase